MKTAKLTWLFISLMMASIFVMPAPIRAETKDLKISIEVIRSPIALPENETFPYVNVWRIWCMTSGIEDWEPATNRTRAELADVTIPEEIDQVMFKFYIHEAIEGWYINPFYYGETSPLNATDYGTTADGDPWVSTTLGNDSYDVYANTYFNDAGPVIDFFIGFLIGGTEQSAERITYTAVKNIPEGKHHFFISAFSKDCIDDGSGKLVEQWLSSTDYFPINLHYDDSAAKAGGNEVVEKEESMSLVFGLLALCAVSMIVMIRKKK